MSDDLIKRKDAIATIGVMYERCDTYDITDYRDLMLEAVKVLPSADRRQEDVDAVAIFMREMHNLEQGYITISEFDERIEPLRHLCYDRPQGEWITEYNGTGWNDYWDYTCTNCKMKFPRADDVLQYAHYCPSCGARMKGADDEDN